MRIAAWGLSIVMCAGYAAGQSAGVPAQDVAVAQGADGAVENAQFEVATIKPSDPANSFGRVWGRSGRRIETRNWYLQWMIKWAYGLQDKQIVGGPAWMNVDRYDVTGEVEGTKPVTDRQCRLAMQKLMADRFGLKFHHEVRNMPAYVLTVAKGGAKLTKSDPEKDTEPQTGFGGDVGQTMRGYGRDVKLGEFMGDLQRLALDRPIVDRTGFTGTYNFNLTFTREDPGSLGSTDLADNAEPNLLNALEQQLGLKLEKAKADVDVIVIDRAEHPTPD